MFWRYLDATPGEVWQEVHRWCHTRLNGISQEEVQLYRVNLFIHQKNLGTQQFGMSWNVAFSAQSSFLFCLIRSKHSGRPLEIVGLVASLFSEQTMQKMKRTVVVPERRAEWCTWACHTRTGLWWCTGRPTRWCCQLDWTHAALAPHSAQPSSPLSGRPRWTPGDAHRYAMNSKPASSITHRITNQSMVSFSLEYIQEFISKVCTLYFFVIFFQHI